jgi:hypothetical protein
VSRLHGSRGQVFPLWVVAVLTTLALTYMIINYGNTLRWQMRAQNAADAAAQAVMAIQTQHFNEITAMLYASNVEEYRARLLLDGMLNSLNGGGGCGNLPTSQKASGQPNFGTGTGSCDQVFANLLPYYEESVQRYTNDLFLLNDVATLTTFNNWSADSAAMITHLDSSTLCNTTTTTVVISDRGDCAFKYTLHAINPRGGLSTDATDAYQFSVHASYPETENAALFDPGMVDIVTCAKVPPVIAAFGALNAKTHYVIGRAGATGVITEEDWFQPGTLVDSARGTSLFFQPYENYTPADAPGTGLTYDWYGVSYGGTGWSVATTPDPFHTGQIDYRYVENNGTNGLDVFASWWGAMPYDPRLVAPSMPAPTAAAVCPP